MKMKAEHREATQRTEDQARRERSRALARNDRTNWPDDEDPPG